MPKWADKARKSLEGTQQSFVAKTLQETIDEAKTVAGDIQFIMESSGARSDQVIDYDDKSMNAVERFYRSAAKRSSPIGFGIDNIERLLSLYLGQSLVDRQAGEWVQYEGKHYVAFPIVVRLRDGRHVDVFLFCRSLHQKQVGGSLDGRALVNFTETAHKMSFP
jgi:hypothetical protein